MYSVEGGEPRDGVLPTTAGHLESRDLPRSRRDEVDLEIALAPIVDVDLAVDEVRAHGRLDEAPPQFRVAARVPVADAERGRHQRGVEDDQLWPRRTPAH